MNAVSHTQMANFFQGSGSQSRKSVFQGTFGNAWKTFLVVRLGEGLLLASSGCRSEMLLNILQSTGQHPTRMNDLSQNINSVKGEKLCSGQEWVWQGLAPTIKD